MKDKSIHRALHLFLHNLLFERGDTGAFKTARNKLFASNEKKIDNHTLILDMLHSYMSVVRT